MSEIQIVWTLAKLTHETAICLDNLEDEDLVKTALDEGQGLAFRRAAEVLREAGAPVTEVVEHVEKRMETVYREAYDKPLPALSSFADELPATPAMWRAATAR